MKPIPTGIADLVFNEKLAIYPNPAQDRIQIEFGLDKTSKVSFKLTDAMGRLVFSEEITSSTLQFSQAINLTGFASGVYVLLVEVEGKVATKRIIKQ